MRSTTLSLLLLIVSLALTGCGIFPERVALSREVVWAQMGTPARIVDDRPIQVVLPDGKGGWLPGEARLQGMVALDEPTLDYYRNLDAAGIQPKARP
ncbi:MAG: hypothetical protein H0X38_00050 [Planctomycetes bacterium]|nr:hypothetical protein [Planctomycetota bacterium]